MTTSENNLIHSIQAVYKSIRNVVYTISDSVFYWINDYILPHFQDLSPTRSFAVNVEHVSVWGTIGRQLSTISGYFLFIFAILVVVQMIYRGARIVHKTDSIESNFLMLYLASIPYGIPFLEALNNFGKSTMPHLPIGVQLFYNDNVRPILEGSYLELNIVYVILLFSQYVIFIQPKRLHKFTRYHMLHSILVYMTISLLGIMYWALPENLTQNLYGELLCDLCLLICMSMIIHAFFKAICGQYCKIPVISEAVRIHLEGY